jgi:hypothetical protein
LLEPLYGINYLFKADLSLEVLYRFLRTAIQRDIDFRYGIFGQLLDQFIIEQHGIGEERKFDLWVDLQQDVHHTKKVLVHDGFKRRELKVGSVFDDWFQTFYKQDEIMKLHDLDLSIMYANAVIIDETMLALQVASACGL